MRRCWVLLLLLFFLLPRMHPPRPLVVLGSPQTVQTEHPIVGVHTRLTDEVDEWKVQRTLQMVREMGAPWIVEFFPWAYMEPFEQGDFTWDHANMVIEHAENQGIQVIARLGTVPEWARPEWVDQPTTWNYLDQEHYLDFAAFVGQFVEHFHGRVQHIIIWNEPNLSFEWGYRPVDPEGYTELLAQAYRAAKAADPEIVVLGGALAPTLEPAGSATALNDLDYLERMYAAGAADYFDALAVHAYGWTHPTDAAPDPMIINFRRTELIREIMVRNGDQRKPVYITEGGWNDHPRWTNAVRPGERVDYTVGAYAYAEANWPSVEAVCLWAFRFPAAHHNYYDYYAFVASDFTPRIVYDAVQAYALGTGEGE